jgi:hypothetical protein
MSLRLYYHLDRGRYLKPDDVLRLIPCQNDIFLSTWGAFISPDLISHLRDMAKQGLSRHGHAYLVNLIIGTFSISSYMVEIFWEYVRWREYPDKPSRFQSVFAWDDLERAIEFAKQAGSGVVFEIENDGRYFVADMNLLRLDFDPDKQMNRARLYWEGRPGETDTLYTPQWEYLVVPPARVVRGIPLSQNYC